LDLFFGLWLSECERSPARRPAWPEGAKYIPALLVNLPGLGFGSTASHRPGIRKNLPFPVDSGRSSITITFTLVYVIMRFGIPNTPRKTGCGGNGVATSFKDGIEPCSPVSSFPSFFSCLIRTSLSPLTCVGTAPRKHPGPGNMSAEGHLLRPDPWETAHEHP